MMVGKTTGLAMTFTVPTARSPAELNTSFLPHTLYILYPGYLLLGGIGRLTCWIFLNAFLIFIDRLLQITFRVIGLCHPALSIGSPPTVRIVLHNLTYDVRLSLVRTYPREYRFVLSSARNKSLTCSLDTDG